MISQQEYLTNCRSMSNMFGFFSITQISTQAWKILKYDHPHLLIYIFSLNDIKICLKTTWSLVNLNHSKDLLKLNIRLWIQTSWNKYVKYNRIHFYKTWITFERLLPISSDDIFIPMLKAHKIQYMYLKYTKLVGSIDKGQRLIKYKSYRENLWFYVFYS